MSWRENFNTCPLGRAIAGENSKQAIGRRSILLGQQHQIGRIQEDAMFPARYSR